MKLNTSSFSLLQHCQPDCEEIHYTAIPTAAPFRRCDVRSFGVNPLCDLALTMDDQENNSLEMINPPLWGSKVMEEYRIVMLNDKLYYI